MNEKRQIFIDASSLKESNCFRRLWYKIYFGYKNKEEKTHKMAFGNGIHVFLENYYNLVPLRECVDKALNFYKPFNETLEESIYEFRTENNLIKICREYSKKFPRKNEETILLDTGDFQPLIDSNNKRMVEYKFAIPIWLNENYELILCGTIDMIAEYLDYPLLLIDHKTTALRESDEFFDNYYFDIQPMLYSKVWKDTHNLKTYPPVLINGIFVKKPTQKAEKEGFFDGCSIRRGPIIQYNDSQMQEFEYWLDKKLELVTTILASYEDIEQTAKNNFDMASCRSVYGMCEFFNTCKLPREHQQAKLDYAFEKVVYNPLRFRD